MEISYSTFDPKYDYLEEVFNDLLTYVFNYLKLKSDPLVSVSVIDNEAIHEINRVYRGVDRPTDVISFAFMDDDLDREKKLKKKGVVDLGEIYISLPRAIEQSIEYGHSLEREVDFLYVHGLLHLLGYDHMEKEDEEVMFKLQEDILSSKGITR